ncbi:hypothetical protein [Kribbella sp. NBC_00359]|uniref:hypothetical protein n=1 Tax=Kribbella sp. NBC_00359 TaxID=2975966 RepID=UPI002E1F60AF
MKVTSYQELMAEQARSAVRVSGAHHSSWNGRHVAAAPERKVRGAVTWDNTIEYNDEKVNAPIKEMFANARVYNQDAETLQWYREAVKTVFHENTHLLAAEGSDHPDAMQAFKDPSVRALEEGVTEVHSYDNLNRYIDDLGLEEVAPGISSADADPSYRQFTPAARRFTEAIGRDTGLGSVEVVRRLAVVNAEQKFRVAAELLYDNSELPGMVPDQERDAAVRRIEAAMKPAFAGVDDLSKLDGDQLRRKSAKAGAAAARAGQDEIRTLKQQWNMPAPEQQVQRAVGPEQNRASQQGPAQGEAQGRGARGPGAQGPGPVSGPQEPMRTSGPQRPALPPDLAAAARAGLGGSQPLRSATRLAADQQGSRRTTTTPGHERQDPGRQV